MCDAVYVVGSGPSLKGFDPSILEGKDVIAVNHAWHLFPRATALVSADQLWWMKNEFEVFEGFEGFMAINIEQQGAKRPFPHWTTLYKQSQLKCATPHHGIDTNPGWVRGSNSGQMAINVAYHLGAKRIVLLGFDMHGDHWYPRGKWPEGGKAQPNEYRDVLIPSTESVREPLEALGVEVINCTPDSALKAFKQGDIHDYI